MVLKIKGRGAGAPAGQQAPVAPKTRWGQPGISELYMMQDKAIAIQPNQQSQTLKDAGILPELRLHYNGTVTVTHNTGTNGKDVYGPYSAIQRIDYVTSPSLFTQGMSGHMLGVLQRAEYPNQTWEAQGTASTVMNPLANTSDFFNYPASGTNAILRFWAFLPIAIRLAGFPGGIVGPVVLQNKQVSNSVQVTFGLGAGGVSGAWNFASSTGFGAAPYNVTGNDTVVGQGNLELWKTLYSVPTLQSDLPIMGFVRVLQESLKGYSGSQFSYEFEPGGGVLRFIAQIEDNSAGGGITTTNVSSLQFQYGIAHKSYDITPHQNIVQQLNLYNTVLGQGVYVFDFYTQSRSLRDVQSAENNAAMEFIANFAPTYAPPANSQVRMLIDKIVVVQNAMGK